MNRKMPIWLTALPLSLCVTAAAIANEPKINEHKDNGTGDTLSDADFVRHADRNTTVDVDTVAETGDQQQDRSFDDRDSYSLMEQRRREFMQAQQESYQRYLERLMERRLQQTPADYAMPADMQKRRELFLKQVEERKQLMDRVRDGHRKAAEERRNTRLQQMNQTCIKTASADKA